MSSKKPILYVTEKTCDNCDGLTVCFSKGKELVPCEDWDIAYDAFEDALDKLSPEERKHFDAASVYCGWEIKIKRD